MGKKNETEKPPGQAPEPAGGTGLTETLEFLEGKMTAKTKTKVKEAIICHCTADVRKNSRKRPREIPYEDWKPGPGIDHDLKKFRCMICGGDFYKVVKHDGFKSNAIG